MTEDQAIEGAQNAGGVLKQLAEMRRNLMDKKEELTNAAAEIKKSLDSLDETLISSMASMGVDKIQFPGIGTISLKNSEFPRFSAGHRKQVMAILKRVGAGDLVFETVTDADFKRWWREEVDRLEAEHLASLKEGEMPVKDYGSQQMIAQFENQVAVYRKTDISFRRT